MLTFPSIHLINNRPIFSIKGVVPDKIQITTADFLNVSCYLHDVPNIFALDLESVFMFQVSLENMGDIKGRLQCSFRFLDGKVVNSEPARQDPHDG